MKSTVAALVAATLFALHAASAQDKPVPPAPAAVPQDEPYQPGLGEIMSLQQMRHIKLWFAGNAANWPLADYEIGELGEGFDDVRKLLGSDIVDQHVGAPIAALQKAIDGKDRKAFVAAFDNLSSGCNACHHALDHGFIAIRRPNMLPYSNQNFVPQK
ncbi:MAG TPA: hypothetical protein VE396_15450 [Xanthobacteraceae bacterium]|nr:hypothetical protein [Xanthobacteraceae bacterium]